MRIAMFSPGVVPPKDYGGTERVVHWLVRELAGQGHEVLFAGPPGCRVPEASRSVEVDLPPGNLNAMGPEMVDLAAAFPEPFDLLHLHCASPAQCACPTVKTVHGYPFHYTGRPEFAARSEFGPEYSFVSRTHATTCGWPEGDVVLNGIDPDEYVFRADHDGYLLFLGRVDWNVKGLPLAVRLARQGGLPLKIAGTFLDQANYASQLEPELYGGVEYVGPVAGRDKAELLAGAMALVNPVVWPEPFGLVVVEALASGTPVLTTPHGAMPEIMEHGVTGFMARSLPETLQQIELLPTIDPARCREHVQQHFTAARMARDYIQLYLKRIRQFRAGLA